MVNGYAYHDNRQEISNKIIQNVECSLLPVSNATVL